MISLFLFLCALFFFKIPSFYLFPFIHNSLLTSQSFARIAFLFVFICNIVMFSIKGKKNLFGKNTSTVVFFIVLLFFFQSLSIVSISNMSPFLTRYKDIVIGYVSFFNFYFYRKEVKKIIGVLLLSVVINSLYQGLMLISKDIYTIIAHFFIYDKQFELSLINLERGRLFLDAFDESLLPLILLHYKEKRYQKVNGMLFVLVCFFSFVSNWRIRIVMVTIAFLSSLFFLFQKTKKVIIQYFICFIAIGFLVNIFLQYTVGFSFFDRFTLQNKIRDWNTISFRGLQIQEGIMIGESSLLGVGLGNYFDAITPTEKTFHSASSLQESEVRYANEYVHNIFILMLAESGLISVGIFIFILILFMRNDMRILGSENIQKKAFVLSFWTLFVYSLLNPPIPGTYQMLFWGIRGLLL